MSDDAAEHKAVEKRVKRLQLGAQMRFGDTGGEPFRQKLEAELVGAYAQGKLDGLVQGYRTAQHMASRSGPPPIPPEAKRARIYTPLSHPPPAPLSDEHKTPVRWVDPSDTRRER